AKLDAGKNEASKSEYEIILRELNSETEKIDPHLFFRVYNNLGVCELNFGNPDRAAELFEKAYSFEPEQPTAIANYALSKMLKDKPKDGLTIVNKLLKEHPNHNHAISVKANILHALKQYNELIPFLKKNGKTALVYWYSGFEAMDKKDYDIAISFFENLINLEPKNTKAHLLAAQNVMVGTKEFFKENAFPSDKIPPPIKEKFIKAISWLKRVIELLQDEEQKSDLEMAYTNLSGCYVAIGIFDEALGVADKATAIDSTSAIPFLNKGIAQLKTGKHKEAINSFRRYKELGGGDIDADRHIAFCYLRAGDLDTAEKIIVPLLEQEGSLDLDIAELGVELYSRRLNNEKLE
ncbi:MAG: tetratricopeptide repeat protein, partial [bacterium]|nr:tetratricopeptide repeat protein [bacterium]